MNKSVTDDCRVCILMMQKNESDLFPVWVEHHGALFGYENLYVFDNGSDLFMDEPLRSAERKGVIVDRQHNTAADFQVKGHLIAGKIRELDRSSPYDFYIPVDCDEFIGVEMKDRAVSVSRKDVLGELERHRRSPNVLMIRAGYDNHPVDETIFARKARRKCFFAQGSCRKLSLGFHSARVANGTKEERTEIVYIHMHYKPLDLMKRYAQQKLLSRVENFNRATLVRYKDEKKQGFHLIDYLLSKNQEEYAQCFERRFPPENFSYVSIPSFASSLKELGIDRVFRTRTALAPISPALLSAFAFGNGQDIESYIAVSANLRYSPDRSYGWLSCDGIKSSRREESNSVFAGLVVGKREAVFRLELAPGLYHFEVDCGDLKGVERSTRISVSEAKIDVPEFKTSGREFAQASFDIDTSDGVIDIAFSTSGEFWSVNAIRVFTAVERRPPLVRHHRIVVDRWKLPAETDRGARAIFQRWRNKTENADLTAMKPTGLCREDYLSVVESCVDHFAVLQDDSGAIIDPCMGVEFQYSTPCFAYAAALVAVNRNRDDLLGPALRAFRKSADDLGRRAAADGHEDFYPSPLAHAYRVLSGRVADETLAEVVLPLKSFDPYQTYRKPPGGRGGSGSNWNCKALAGHQLLLQFGIRDKVNDKAYVEESLKGQGWMFSSEHGMYMEGPSTYDAFPRAWLSDMLEWGYAGARRDDLVEALDRASLASLFLQSPTGEIACGGRSAHHQWADALQCVIFEIAAKWALGKGDRSLSAIFKRAAHRALAAILPWRRQSGELWVVKNRIEPMSRHGFESYSSHSQYNLLAVTALGYAFEHAETTEDVGERLTPAEHGASLIEVGAPVDLVVGNAAGTQVLVVNAAKPGQNPKGMARVHFAGLDSQLAITDGFVALPNYQLPESPGINLSAGLAWQPANNSDCSVETLVSLADMNVNKVSSTTSMRLQTIKRLVFDICHNLSDSGPSSILEQYSLHDGLLEISYTWSTWEGDIYLRWPVAAGDGSEATMVSTNAGQVSVAFRGGRVRFTVSGTEKPKMARRTIATRNGYARICSAKASRQCVTLSIERI